MPLYNKATYVRRAVESVLKQTVGDFELIVIDDGSTDAGARVVEAINDPRIRLIRQANAGVSAARNRGIAAARAELIAFLDADDEWLPGFLEAIWGLHAEYPHAAVWATAYRRISREGKDITSRFSWLRSSRNSGTHIIDFFSDEHDYEDRIHTCSLVVKRDAILAVGGFPENIVQGEDSDTWFRLALRYQTAWASGLEAVYHMDAGNHLWAGDEYWYYGVRPTMASFRRFVTERGGSEGISASVYSFITASLESQLEANLLAGDSRAVRKIVRDLRSINKCGPFDRRAYLLSLLPNGFYRRLWFLRRVIRRRNPKMREFRSIHRVKSCR
jgi:glycosyltransferase involved in cell wall biosynthesis